MAEVVHTNIFSSFDHEKNAHAVFLENPELVNDVDFV